MANNRKHFEEFQPHTLLKHAILRTYLQAWAMKIITWGGAGQTVFYVDAFAGAGQDESGNPGSPLIAAKIASEMREVFESKPATPAARMRVIAIEREARHVAALTDLVHEFNEPGEPDLVRVLQGDMIDHIDVIANIVGLAPTLYFLDPFGVQGLDASTYPRLLAGPHNEIFALFADLGATRLHGLVTAARSDIEQQLREIREVPYLFPEINAELEASARAAADQRNLALDLSQPAARKYLARALGDPNAVETIAQLPKEDRADAILDVFIRALIAATARYVIAIPIRKAGGNRAYSLVHASKSASGFIAMKAAVSSGLNKADFPENMRQKMREDLSMPLDPVIDNLRQRFAGKGPIPWSGEKGHDQHTVRHVLLESTAVFDFQVEEIKTVLKDEGLLRRENRKLVCYFPSLSALT